MARGAVRGYRTYMAARDRVDKREGQRLDDVLRVRNARPIEHYRHSQLLRGQETKEEEEKKERKWWISIIEMRVHHE